MDTETGRVTIRRYVCVDDVGTVANPLIVEGQVHGGVAQGIAQALFEEAVYDEGGTLITGTLITGTLADYLMPSAADLPHFTTDRTVTPSTTNPLGVKGVGEAGTIASTPAVVNAVVEAVQVLSQAGEDAKVLAGGQSLVPVLRLRLAAPATLVDLGRISELRGVREDGDAILVGAMTTLTVTGKPAQFGRGLIEDVGRKIIGQFADC